MNAWLKIAARNLVKNGRRSLYTVIAIMLGFAAVNLFGGFTSYLFATMERGFINATAIGHLTIYKEGFNVQGQQDPANYLIGPDELATLNGILSARDDVIMATPKLQVQGLVSNGQISTVFVGLGDVPEDVLVIRKQAGGFFATRKMFDGEAQSSDKPFGLALSAGLAEMLGVEFGDNAVVMAPTVAGHINALDGEVIASFNAAVAALNDKLMNLTLPFAQSLYDTDSVDRVVVLFADGAELERKRGELTNAFAASGLKMEMLTWTERTPFYVRVKQMFNFILAFLFIIVFVIVVMSVVNTVGMAVMERTREIGTLRALGLRRAGIVRLFALESLLLGVIGSIAGLVCFLLVWFGIFWFEPEWTPPTFDGRLPFEIHIVPSFLVLSTLFLCLLSLAAAVLPARRAARLEIVDALGHV